eukprot:4752521-Pleurochrysis_carterae.AAC.3
MRHAECGVAIAPCRIVDVPAQVWFAECDGLGRVDREDRAARKAAAHQRHRRGPHTVELGARQAATLHLRVNACAR